MSNRKWFMVFMFSLIFSGCSIGENNHQMETSSTITASSTVDISSLPTESAFPTLTKTKIPFNTLIPRNTRTPTPTPVDYPNLLDIKTRIRIVASISFGRDDIKLVYWNGKKLITILTSSFPNTIECMWNYLYFSDSGEKVISAGDYSIWVVDVNEKEPRKLLSIEEILPGGRNLGDIGCGLPNNYWIDWLPDNENLIIAVSTGKIYSLNVNSGLMTQMIDVGEFLDYQLSPDRRYFAITYYDKITLYQLDQKKLIFTKQFTPIPYIRCGYETIPQKWSPDSQSILIVIPPSNINQPLGMDVRIEDSRIIRIFVDGSEKELKKINLEVPFWNSFISPDTEWIYYHRSGKDNYQNIIMRLDGDEQYTFHTEVNIWSDFKWSPDSLHFSYWDFVGYIENGNLQLIKNKLVRSMSLWINEKYFLDTEYDQKTNTDKIVLYSTQGSSVVLFPLDGRIGTIAHHYNFDYIIMP